MRILVCGGRDFNDWPRVREVLGDLCDKHSKMYNPDDNWLPSDITIITGGCPTGADALAADFAMIHWTGYKEYKADWKSYGHAAGPIRNQRMIDDGKPDIVVAFKGGTGTADMVTKARAAGVKVIEIA